MAITPITQALTPIAHIPDRITMNQATFDENATLYSNEIKQLGLDLATWAQQANNLATAINLALNLGIGNSDFLRFVRAPGDILYTAAATPPFGTLACDSRNVSRAIYADLFAALNPNDTWTGFTVTSPATPAVFTSQGHGLIGYERLRLKTTGTLPDGLSTTVDYFVGYPTTANAFTLYTLVNNVPVAVNTKDGTDTGAHTFHRSLWGIGDGTTTFTLPDLRGVHLKGIDTINGNARGFDFVRSLASLQLFSLQEGSTNPMPNFNVALLPCIVY